MAIIVVSHQMGAGGPEIGMSVAQRLGYRYVNQELLLDAARRYGLAEDKLSHLDESKPTLFERFDTETRHHITVLQTACLEFAEDDHCVFMRGGARPPSRDGDDRGGPSDGRLARAGLASASRAGDASGDAALPDHGRGARRRRHARGYGGARARRRGGALCAGRARSQDSASRDSAHSSVRRLARDWGGAIGARESLAT